MCAIASIYLIVVVSYILVGIIYRSNAKLVPRQKPRLLYHHIAYSDWRHMHANCDGFKGKWLGMGASSSTFGLWRLPLLITAAAAYVLYSGRLLQYSTLLIWRSKCQFSMQSEVVRGQYQRNGWPTASSSSFGRSFSPSLFAAFIMHPKPIVCAGGADAMMLL